MTVAKLSKLRIRKDNGTALCKPTSEVVGLLSFIRSYLALALFGGRSSKIWSKMTRAHKKHNVMQGQFGTATSSSKGELTRLSAAPTFSNHPSLILPAL